ncbi:sulfotransferase [Pseudomaricurvus alkylphenolicus]|uniref:sulfotransferase family protein n=1 Tax=Pseudomaricurvus alkylphenolicus TaxID=1306991 RepID=UPI0014235050|nr:sulfotransferase [Pseudomaricurvus alkylphenolicus]NIB39004.1 sulfotransferase [Pseudomaricurvus alkylphenolicus]
MNSSQLNVSNLMAVAMQRTQLSDFGPEHFVEPLEVLLKSMREEARLSPAGLRAQSERLINALCSRLRKTAFLQKHPQVLNEEIKVAAVIVGLPRTGSTMLQRLIAASPKLTATRWWETIFPMPLEGEVEGDPSGRIQQAESLVENIMGAAENFDSIHPLDAHAYDEELTLIEQSFISNMPESMMYVPSYGKWLLQADQSNAYAELVEYLKILQWQTPKRRRQQWVLKSPHHLTAIDTVLDVFSSAVIINTHRSITDVMPSWYSMVGSLTEADSDAEGLRQAQAKHWTWRLNKSLQGFMKSRAGHADRFMDIDYRTLLDAPIETCESIFKRAGLTLEDEDRQAFASHTKNNRRGKRPAHQYNLASFGVSRKELESEFDYYQKIFN